MLHALVIEGAARPDRSQHWPEAASGLQTHRRARDHVGVIPFPKAEYIQNAQFRAACHCSHSPHRLHKVIAVEPAEVRPESCILVRDVAATTRIEWRSRSRPPRRAPKTPLGRVFKPAIFTLSEATRLKDCLRARVDVYPPLMPSAHHPRTTMCTRQVECAERLSRAVTIFGIRDIA